MCDTPRKISFPSLYLVTPEPRDPKLFLKRLEELLAGGIRLVQLRAKTLDAAAYAQLARRALALCAPHGAHLLLNAAPALAEEIDASGVHLTSERLMQTSVRPLAKEKWVAASCHNEQEIAHAARIGVDFIVVGPVLATASHPHATLLGWEGLKRLTARAAMPVYALGGLSAQDIEKAQACGAQGIAAITGIWQQNREQR